MEPLFTKPFNNWEMEDVKRLLLGLGRYVLHVKIEDIVN